MRGSHALSIAALLATACSEPESFIAHGEPPVTGSCTPGKVLSDPFVDCIDSIATAPGASFGHEALPDIVFGPPVGDAAGIEGGMDVASLGCGGSITVMFDGDPIVDRDGPDLLVFENPFVTGTTTFAEPARVLVSDDGETWYAFPCEVAGDGSSPPRGCAGVEPVGSVQPGSWDPDTAGGDAFDLADIGLSSARWLRLVDVTEAHYGHRMWCAGAAGGFDFDAAAIALSWVAPQ